MAYTPQSTTSLLDVRPIDSSPASAPVFTIHRQGIAAPDAADASPIKASSGMNMAGYEKAIIHVVPKTGSPTPDIEVLQWSESAGKFVSFATAKSASAPGADTPYAYECDVFGSVIWVRVTGTISSATVDVLIAGAEIDHDS